MISLVFCAKSFNSAELSCTARTSCYIARLNVRKKIFLLRSLTISRTGLDPICIELLELIGNGMNLLRRTTSDRPFEIGREVLNNVFRAETTSISSRSQQNQIILSVGRHF